MVTRSASFSAKTNQTPPVKAKESSGAASKKAGRKKDELLPTTPILTTPMEVSDADTSSSVAPSDPPLAEHCNDFF